MKYICLSLIVIFLGANPSFAKIPTSAFDQNKALHESVSQYNSLRSVRWPLSQNQSAVWSRDFQKFLKDQKIQKLYKASVTNAKVSFELEGKSFSIYVKEISALSTKIDIAGQSVVLLKGNFVQNFEALKKAFSNKKISLLSFFIETVEASSEACGSPVCQQAASTIGFFESVTFLFSSYLTIRETEFCRLNDQEASAGYDVAGKNSVEDIQKELQDLFNVQEKYSKDFLIGNKSVVANEAQTTSAKNLQSCIMELADRRKESLLKLTDSNDLKKKRALGCTVEIQDRYSFLINNFDLVPYKESYTMFEDALKSREQKTNICHSLGYDPCVSISGKTTFERDLENISRNCAKAQQRSQSESRSSRANQ